MNVEPLRVFNAMKVEVKAEVKGRNQENVKTMFISQIERGGPS